MFVYFPVEHEINSPYIGQYRTFGIQVLHSGKDEDQELMILPDVSTDFEFTLRLASLLTRKRLSPLHLWASGGAWIG